MYIYIYGVGFFQGGEVIQLLSAFFGRLGGKFVKEGIHYISCTLYIYDIYICIYINTSTWIYNICKIIYVINVKLCMC